MTIFDSELKIYSVNQEERNQKKRSIDISIEKYSQRLISLSSEVSDKLAVHYALLDPESL